MAYVLQCSKMIPLVNSHTIPPPSYLAVLCIDVHVDPSMYITNLDLLEKP